MEELVKYYKNKYEETLEKLNETEKTIKILNERIEVIECFSDSDFEADYESEEENNEDTEEEENNKKNQEEDDNDFSEEENDEDTEEEDDNDSEEEDDNDFSEEDQDFSEEEIKKIKEKLLSFKNFRKSKSDFSSEEEYNKQRDLFNNNKQLLPVYLIEEIEECEKRISFKLPIALKNYITKVSREFIYTNYGFYIEIILNNISHTDVSLYLSGSSCSNHNKIYIQGNKKNKVASWRQNNYTREYSSICAYNFKNFVIYTLNLQKNKK